jgi:hypothetical protein
MLLQRLLLLCSVLVVAVNASRTNQERDEVAIGWDPSGSLVGHTGQGPTHSVLNSLSPKYKNGKDKEVPCVHSEDSPQATSVLKLAKRFTNSSHTTPTLIPGTGGTTTSETKAPPTAEPTSAGPLTSVVFTTYTLPNGHVTTSTGLVIVNIPTTPSTFLGAGGSSTSLGPPSIQTFAAGSTNGFAKEMALMLGGAVAFALVL